ncbi:MAG: SHOCT domain-containing protein, partial [Actinomycetota bacterium]
MPGLLRGVARTAVVAGTASAVSLRVSRRQANRWSSQDPQSEEEQPCQQQQAYA